MYVWAACVDSMCGQYMGRRFEGLRDIEMTKRPSETCKTSRGKKEKYARIGESTNAPVDPCTLHAKGIPWFTNDSR